MPHLSYRLQKPDILIRDIRTDPHDCNVLGKEGYETGDVLRVGLGKTVL